MNQILFNDNFDGTQFTPPSSPSEWTFTTFVTSTMLPRSAPNSVACPVSAQVALALSKSQDLVAGNVIASCWIYMDATSNGVNKWLFARGTFPSGNWGVNQTCYYTQVMRSGTAGQSTVGLNKSITGTATGLGATLSGDMFSNAGWYQVLTVCSGTTISSMVLRGSDGMYLNSAGVYQSAPTTVQSVTDSSISGAGLYGFGAYNPTAGGAVYFDDFELDSATALPAAGLTLLAIGDSITAGIAVGAQVGPLVTTASTLAGLHGSRTVQVINQGRGSSMAKDWLPGGALMAMALAAANTYTIAGQKWAQVELGVNDANSGTYTTQAAYQANLSAICTYLVSQGYKVILHAPTYVVPGADAGLFTAQSDTLIKAYQDAILATVDNISIFLGDTNGFDVMSAVPSLLGADQVHQTPTGAVVLGNLWAEGDYRAIYLASGLSASLPGAVAGLANSSGALAALNSQAQVSVTIPARPGVSNPYPVTAAGGIQYLLPVGIPVTVPQSVQQQLLSEGLLNPLP